MRFIYLSRTEELDFETRKDTIKFFEDFLIGVRHRFNIKKDGTRSKIDKSKFNMGEDIIFVRIEDTTTAAIEVIAYCKSGTGLIDNTSDHIYPMYFEPDKSTLKIFVNGIDLRLFDKFVFDNGIKGVSRDDYFTSFLTPGKTLGHTSWRHFEEDDSLVILEFLKQLVVEEHAYFSRA